MKSMKFSKLPSEILRVSDSLAAWMLDSAVVWFGITIENALLERVKMGSESKPRYSLSRLLSGQKLPRPPYVYEGDGGSTSVNVWSPLLSWAGRPNSGVKRWKYVPPDEAEQNSEVNDG